MHPLLKKNLDPPLRCNDNLPQRILNHLRLQPLIFVKCCRLFCKWLVSYFRISRIVLPFLKVSTGWLTWCFRVPIFIVFLSTIPVATVVLLLAMLVVVLISIFITSPIMTLLFTTSFYPLKGIFSSVLVALLLQIFVKTFSCLWSMRCSGRCSVGFNNRCVRTSYHFVF